jgi:hypothetical protein
VSGGETTYAKVGRVAVPRAALAGNGVSRVDWQWKDPSGRRRWRQTYDSTAQHCGAGRERCAGCGRVADWGLSLSEARGTDANNSPLRLPCTATCSCGMHVDARYAHAPKLGWRILNPSRMRKRARWAFRRSSLICKVPEWRQRHDRAGNPEPTADLGRPGVFSAGETQLLETRSGCRSLIRCWWNSAQFFPSFTLTPQPCIRA